MTTELNVILDRVVDRETFLEFARALENDRRDEIQKEQESPSLPYGPGHNGWEKSTIENFLDAAITWAQDAAGSPNELPEKPEWHSFARFLYAGKHYE